jgi:hypothetical protein
MRKLLKFLLLSGCLFMVGGCSQNRENKFQKNLKKSFQKDTLVRLDSLVSEKGNMACILYPYENSIDGEDVRIKHINENLKSKNIIADEGTWYLIVLQNDEIVSIPMKRDIDVFSPDEIKKISEIEFPKDFKPAQCVNFDQAYFYQTSVKNRNYIILGSKQ